MVLHRKVAETFPGLGDYLGVLNKAVILDDHELITYVCRKIAGLLTDEHRLAVNQ